MTDFKNLEVHPVADAFPLMEGEEFDRLLHDIEKNGLQVPLTLASGGKILVDGRNRLAVMNELGLEPSVQVLSDDYDDEAIVALILSLNVHRRHLDAAQRGHVAGVVEQHYAIAAKERQRQSGGSKTGWKKGDGTRKSVTGGPHVTDNRSRRTAAAQAAKDVGASAKSVQRMKTLETEAPDLAEKALSKELSLEQAWKEYNKRERDKKKDAPPKDEKPTGKVMLTLLTFDGESVPYPQPKSKPSFQKTNEQVSWASWTWNPVTGCNHGCNYCYARELAYRPSYATTYPVQFTPLFHHERLDAPANSLVPESAPSHAPDWRVFVCSMADLYGKWVPDDWIEQVHEKCRENPQWEYLFLTKFPSRYTKLTDLPKTGWFGTTVDDQRRVPLAEGAFRDIEGVKVKWLSLEPLLAPLKFTDLSMFDWVVIGSQSGTNQPTGWVPPIAPPFEWVARLVDQAHEAGCKVYLKPNLLGDCNDTRPGMTLPQEMPTMRFRRR
jgi:protein gp37